MKRVAIVGFAPSCISAPYADESIEIWTMNFHHTQLPRSSRIFELHDWAIVESEGFVESFRSSKVPVYLQESRPDVPMSVTYPIREMASEFGVDGRANPYFTNTISYMLALAIAEGFEEIQVFGVDMSHSTEYGSQRPSCEFFLGIAKGRGIRLVMHPDSELLQTPFLYGYEDGKRNATVERLKSRHAVLAQRHAQHTAEAAKHQQACYELAGAIQDNDEILRTWIH